MKKVKQNKYKAFGLIEAIIAIAISAIIAVLFMQVMIQEIVDMKKIENIDQMSKNSLSTAEYVTRIASKNNGRDPSSPMVFPDVINNPGLIGKCFTIDNDLTNPTFNNLSGDCIYDTGMVDCRNQFSEDVNMFSVYCITDSYPGNNQTVVIGKIVTGLTKCTTNCNTPDFEYTFIVNINDL